LWDRTAIQEGAALITAALPRGPTGPYQLQAAIAAVHDEASSAETTDWAQIAALYEVLLRLDDNPVVALNHAVAVSMVSGPGPGPECAVAIREPTSEQPFGRDMDSLSQGRRCRAERRLVDMLGSLPGFAQGTALASAVLTAASPTRLAVYDKRARRGLQKVELELADQGPAFYGMTPPCRTGLQGRAPARRERADHEVRRRRCMVTCEAAIA